MRNKALGFVLAKLVGSPADAQISHGLIEEIAKQKPGAGLRPGLHALSELA